jgi:putative hydrolase of the HAD superfamily
LPKKGYSRELPRLLNGPSAGLPRVYDIALDIAQAQARQEVYIENTPMFVQIAESLGIRSILHTDYKSTFAKLASFGLQNDGGVIHETS